ncbi:MAG: ATPase [Chitinophaga sp.]|jgi:hypothetical protein|nr:ATPase [Chitinophaga sp.]
MSTKDFSLTIIVEQSPEVVFNAVNNVSEWWQGEIIGKSHQLNDEFDYRMMDFHFSKQKVVELIPYKKIVWLITDSNLSSFTHNQEWTGTKVIFDISIVDNQTELTFTHAGLTPQFQCYGDCSGAWSELVGKSLYSLITTGKGKKVF